MFQLKIPYGGLADILTDRQVKIVPRNATTVPETTGSTGDRSVQLAR